MVKFLQALDEQQIHRHPDGATPIGVSSEESGLALCRFVAHVVRLTVDPQRIRPIGERARDAADAVRREKVLLVKRLTKKRFHPMSTEKREKPPFAAPRLIPTRNKRGHLRSFTEEPLKALAKDWELREDFRLDRLNCKERNQSDDREDLDGLDATVGHAHEVVVKAVVLIPEPDVFAAHLRHRFGDLQEVLEELRRHVLVKRPIMREFNRHAHHREREHRHPTRSVGLLQSAAAGEGLRAIEDADVVEAEESTLEDVSAGGVLSIDPPGEVEE